MENKLEKIGQNNFMDNFVKTDDILKDMCGIIESSQKAAYQAVNTLLVQRNWLIGYRIANEGWHRIDFETQSRFADIFETSSIMVNSYHHQGIRVLGKGCEIKGKSEDGVPEAIEVMNHPFALAVQWHPEMMFDSEEQVKLLAAFVDAAKKF